MTLPSSGSLSLSQIKAEFGRGNSFSGYRGVASGVPSSGTLSFSHFYGKSNIIREPASGEYYTRSSYEWWSYTNDNFWGTGVTILWAGSYAAVSGDPNVTAISDGSSTYYRGTYREPGYAAGHTTGYMYAVYRITAG